MMEMGRFNILNVHQYIIIILENIFVETIYYILIKWKLPHIYTFDETQIIIIIIKDNSSRFPLPPCVVGRLY